MKKEMIALAATAAACIGFAATPLAVWDRDFTISNKGSFALNENGNTKENGYLQVSGDNGILLTSTDALNFFTVIVRCEGLNLSAENAQVLFTSYGTDGGANDNKTGVYLPSSNAACCGIWAGGAWSPTSDTAGYADFVQNSVPANCTTLIYNHQQNNGTYAYALGPTSDVDDTIVRTTLYSILGLRSSGTTYKGCSIGGLRGTTSASLLPATDLKITSLAVFSGTLTEAEMKEYIFPSEMPVFNVTVSADKAWSEILSDAGITDANKTNANLVITAQNNPKITFDVVDSILYGLTVNGAAVISADDAVYGSGIQSFGKTLLTTSMKSTTEGCLSLPNVEFEVKEGWRGAFVASASDITLYAQNAETISINIGGGGNNTTTVQPSPEANLVSGSEYVGLYPTPGNAWNNISGHWTGGSQTVTLTSAKAFDGETTTVRNTVQLSGTANNTYGVGTAYASFLRGYLDDTGEVEVKIVGVPYSQYDVIIYATSDSSLQLNYFTINNVTYTCGSDGVATEGTSAWGVGQTTTPIFGKNAMLVHGVTGSTLTISGTRAANSGPRVTVCAVQIINKGVIESSDWSANLDATTSFSGGTGVGLSGQSGTWANSSLASIIITNKASDATLTLDGEITAGALKIVGDEGKKLTLDKASGATLDITAYNLTESAEEVTFLFNPDFSKVDAGSNLVGVGYDYAGTIGSGFHYKGSENVLTLGEVNGGSVNIGGEGTISGDLGISGDATVTFSGNYTSSGNTMLGATKGVLTIAEGASVSVPHVRLVNSNGSVPCTMNVNGALTVTSESTGSNVYSERGNYKGILFGHYYGSSTVNVGSTGSINGTAAWVQLTYTAPNTMTVNGGTVKVRGINGGSYSGANSPLTLTGGGVIEVAEGFVNMGHITRDYGYGTIKTYSYGGTTGWADPGAITFADAINGTTIDPCGLTNTFSGVLSGTGKIVVSDSVGGGSVSFTGDLTDFTGDIVVAADSTLNLGTARIAGTLTIDGTLCVTLASKADIPVLKVSSEPAGSITLYDTDGTTQIDAAVSYDAETGTVTIMPPVNTWNVSSNLSFDTADNWTYGLPAVRQDIAINVSGDAVLTINGDYAVSSLTISGAGVVEFTGSGSVIPGKVYLANGATLKRNGKIETSNFILNAGTVLRLTDTVESAVISGAGAVETYGNVDMAALNTFTGGITAKTGTLTTSVAQSDAEGGLWCTGFGEYMQSWACTAQRCITVEDGACVDINNVINGGNKGGIAYRLVIAGKGVLENGVYSGAVKYSAPAGQAKGLNARQISYIELTADAMVDVSTGWGLLHHYYGKARLVLNDHTLTFRGSGASSVVPLCYVNTDQATSGTVVFDGASPAFGPSGSTASNFAGVNVIAKGSPAVNFIVAPSAIGSLAIKPSATGTTSENLNLPSGCVPSVDTSNIDTTGLTDGQVLTIFTAPSELSAETVSVKSSGRFTTVIDGATVKATFQAGMPSCFLHYDFNAENSRAADSVYSFGNLNPSFVASRNGQAGVFDLNYKPYYGSNTSELSPFHAEEMTVTSLIKLKEADNTILWNLGSGWGTGVALIAKDSSTIAIVSWTGGASGSDVVSVSGIPDLMNKWHFVTVVASGAGTTLYVDKRSASVDTLLPADTDGKGQFGSIHGTAKNYTAVAGDGYLLDDWRVYDAALTEKEIEGLRARLNPDPLFFMLR